jgi:aldose 1-epimerase
VAEIRFNDYALSAAPEIGGAVTKLTWRGLDLLRPATGAADPLQTSCFPLAPYANRIAHGAFTFQGKRIQLALNFGDHPHALHGHAWQRPWRLEETSASRMRLSFDYTPGDWPWVYRAEQVFELDESGALLSLSLQNRADTPMPASIGFHPYFPRPRGAVLKAGVRGFRRSLLHRLAPFRVTLAKRGARNLHHGDAGISFSAYLSPRRGDLPLH